MIAISSMSSYGVIALWLQTKIPRKNTGPLWQVQSSNHKDFKLEMSHEV
jgi:hypothetical protein